MKRISLLVAALSLVALSASAKNMYIPIAGVAQGANGTLFRTDLRVFNPSTTKTIGLTVHFLPANQDGRFISGNLYSIPPRQTLVLNDVVGKYLKWPNGSIGALRLDSDDERSWEFSATSRTYTDSPNAAAPGTFGQFIPAVDPANAKNRIVVNQVSNSSDSAKGFRTNVGVMNPGQDEAGVLLKVYAANGSLVGEGTILVPPKSVVQKALPALIGRSSLDLTDGYVIIESTAPVFGYASVVDNRSSDQIFVLGAEDKAD